MPGAYRGSISYVQFHLGVLYLWSQRLDESEGNLRAAAKFVEGLIEDEPARLMLRLYRANTHNVLASTLAAQGRQDEARQLLESAIAEVRELPERLESHRDRYFARHLLGSLERNLQQVLESAEPAGRDAT